MNFISKFFWWNKIVSIKYLIEYKDFISLLPSKFLLSNTLSIIFKLQFLSKFGFKCYVP